MPAKKHIATITVGAGGAASIEFTGIPQTGTDLVIVSSLRDTIGNFLNGINFYINNLSTSNYDWRALQGTGTGVNSSSGSAISTEQALYLNGNGSTASSFTAMEHRIPSYSTTGTKAWLIESGLESNSSTGYQQLVAGHYSASVTGVTSVKLVAGTGFAAGSTASLYMFTKGSGGASVA